MVGKWFMLVFTALFFGYACMLGIRTAMPEEMDRGLFYEAEKGPFYEAKFVKVGNHTYYPENLFELKHSNAEQKEYALKKMKDGDRDLTEDILVTGFNSMYETFDYHLFGHFMVDGVPIEDLQLVCGTRPEGIVEWGSSKYGLLSRLPAPEKVVTDGLIPASEACEKAYALAKENEDKMFEHRKREPIRGSYMLKADIHGDPFYEFLINEHSMVRIRAKDGEVLTAFFWDGVYVD